MAGAGVCRRCDAVGAVKTAEVAGARGCSAARATKVARLAVARAGVCRRCDAVGAVKTAEVAGARGCSAAEYCSGGVRGRAHSTRPSEGAELQGRGPRKCTVREQGPQQSTVRKRRSVLWGPQRPSVGGGAELQGGGPRNPTVGRDPSVQGDDQLRLSLRQRSRHAENYGARHKCYSV